MDLLFYVFHSLVTSSFAAAIFKTGFADMSQQVEGDVRSDEESGPEEEKAEANKLDEIPSDIYKKKQ